MNEMQSYIKKIISSDTQETVSPIDPFKDERVTLPSKTNIKGENFFKLVRTLQSERDATRAAR